MIPIVSHDFLFRVLFLFVFFRTTWSHVPLQFHYLVYFYNFITLYSKKDIGDHPVVISVNMCTSAWALPVGSVRPLYCTFFIYYRYVLRLSNSSLLFFWWIWYTIYTLNVSDLRNCLFTLPYLVDLDYIGWKNNMLRLFILYAIGRRIITDLQTS